MASLQTSIDPDTIEKGQNGFDPMPAGEYAAHIIESDVTPTKSGSGLMLKLTWEILEGEFEKRRVWQNINYQNQSEKAQLIGQQQIKAICDAVGFSGLLDDSEVLHFKPVRLRIGLEKGGAKDSGGTYDDKNDVRAVKPCGTGPSPAGKAMPTAAAKPAATTAPKPAAATTAASKPAAAAPTGSRPWAKSA